jgi:hypothetical protein
MLSEPLGNKKLNRFYFLSEIDKKPWTPQSCMDSRVSPESLGPLNRKTVCQSLWEVLTEVDNNILLTVTNPHGILDHQFRPHPINTVMDL